MNDSVRTFPAFDVYAVTERFEAALADYPVTAIHERSAERWRVFFDRHSERDAAVSELRAAFPDLTFERADVPDENWAARSQASLQAIAVGRIIVAPPWDIPAAVRGSMTIVIQPSMGFGTGHHATTRLCLLALQRLDLAGRSVIDIGTGSGVLAIAASLLGANHVIGIDDDPDAVASARDNRELNCRPAIDLAVADVRAAQLPRADIVIANLTGGLLEATASRLRQLVAPGGRLVVSGLNVDEEAAVAAAFSPLEVEHRAQEGEWLCLTVRAGD